MIGHDLYVDLEWLPRTPIDFKEQLQKLEKSKNPAEIIRNLANNALNINQTNSLSKSIIRAQRNDVDLTPLVSFSLGVVSNSTISTIVQSLVITAARYGISLTVIEAPFGQVMQAALGKVEAFENIKMDAILIAVDYKGLPIHGKGVPTFGDDTGILHESLGYINMIRSQLKQKYSVPCIMQTCAHEPESFFGSFDVQVQNTSRQFINIFNSSLVNEIIGTEDFLLDVAMIAETVGLSNWHDPVMYHMAKLPFSTKMIPFYAEHVCRILAAIRGKARRALVLDLDNTLWGGVVGDDGIDGIHIGHGNVLGESYLAVQHAVLTLRKRGIVLAVCSKNQDSIARSPFIKHPDMLLKENHIAIFQANWNDKASNIKAIADTLKLGLDSIVFLDDNPVERNLVRLNLPQVAVPELPDDPAYYPRILLAAGYFEAVHFSDEDKKRVDDYQANAKRIALQNIVTDMDSYLKTLKMKAKIQSFSDSGIKRVTQLISKSNQFNLTTRRYDEAKIRYFMDNDNYYTIQARLKDSFGDNGTVSAVICKKIEDKWIIKTWVMSCRVLGRRLEESVFYEIVKAANNEGIKSIIGEYIPSDRNEIVREHYIKLGFREMDTTSSYGKTSWLINLEGLNIPTLPIEIK